MELGLGLTKIIPVIIYVTGLIVIFLTFYRIEFGIYFLIPLLTQQSLLEHLRGYPLGKDFIDVLYLVLIIKWILDRQKLIKDPSIRRPLRLSIGAIFLWTFLSLWIGAASLKLGFPITLRNAYFVHWKNFIMLPLLYLIVVNNIKDEKQIKIILILMTLSMLYMDRSFYNNFANKDRSNFSYSLRVGTAFTYLGPNETAVFYAQNSIILLSLFALDTHRRRKILLGITTIFNYWCLMFLYSRGGYLAGIMGWIFFGFAKDRRVLVLLVIGLISWKSFVPASVQQRIEMSNDSGTGIDSSIQARYEMWDQALVLISQNPIIGYGYNTTPALGIETGSGKHRDSLHNGYLQLLLDQGAIGLGIFLFFFLTCFRLGWRLFRTAEERFFKGFGLGYAGCVLAVLAGNIAGSYWFYLNVSGFYWVNLALVVRSLEIVNREKLESKPVFRQPKAKLATVNRSQETAGAIQTQK